MKYTYNDVKEYINNEGYELLSSTYENVRQKLTLSCQKGHVYNASFNAFKSGRRCSKCRKISFEDVLKMASDNDYDVLSLKDNFKNSKSIITVKCKYGHVSDKRCDNLTQRCKECIDSDKRNNYNDIKQFIESEGYTLLDDVYINNSTYLNLLCPNNHKTQITYSNFQQGNRCKECCHDNYRNNFDEIKNIIETRGYTLLSTEYKNIRSELILKCPNEHEFKTNLLNFHYHQNDCPLCNLENKSKGESKIECILNENKIKYIFQHRFDDCTDKKPLPFDFYIPKLNMIIEYDGEQHFRSKSIFGEESFYDTIKHDAIKNSYCEDNNIRLLRIPYWEFKNIEKILTQHINLE